ncbi:MAG: hypothetical protein C0605_11290 [Hyphomicrobiales bacterium]|nr:MAG: hypothetical protein C0605_11290 [Hyphomicrobiales bacterium]
MDRSSLIFCILSLVVSLGIGWLAYPHAAVSPEKLAAWKQPADSEMIPDLDLGDYGTVSAGELMEYYMENPPAPPEAGAKPERELRFQGC